jgi:small glutamine-rich tetratricopeptide repeat-containing protein alpha
MKAALATAETRWAEESTSGTDSVADREPSAGGGAGGGAEGMPDLSALAGMMGGMAGAEGGGGGMPDLASMMQNPQMMAMWVAPSLALRE